MTVLLWAALALCQSAGGGGGTGGLPTTGGTLSGTLTSSVAGSSTAIGFINNFVFLDFGTGSGDYIYSDGIGLVAGTTFQASAFYAGAGGLKIASSPVLQDLGNFTLGMSGYQNNSSSAIGIKVGNTQSLSASGTQIVCFYSDSFSTQVACIASDGSFTSAGNPVPAVHSTQTAAPVATEFGTKVLSGGAGTVTFSTAFSSAPVCTCTDQTAANATKCSTSASVLTVAGTSTDTVAWICLGAK